jgi:FkbM family methyltransferase
LGARLLRVAQKSVFAQLLKLAPPEVLNEVFYRKAASLNVVDMSVRGNYGVIRQSLSDRVMLPVYAKTGHWAENFNEALRAFFATNGGNYIDVGANIGLTTIPIAQNPNVNCLALEPEPSNFRYLEMNVKANCPHSNVTLKRVAAFSKRGTVSFELSSENYGDHRIRLQNAPGAMGEQQRQTIDVKTVPLDEMVTVCARPLAVKIDTQGAEPFVLAGGRATLQRADLLLIEFWPYGMERIGGEPEEIIKLIADHFKTVSLFEGETHDSSPVMPVHDAIEYIRKISSINRANPSFYLDLIAKK